MINQCLFQISFIYMCVRLNLQKFHNIRIFHYLLIFWFWLCCLNFICNRYHHITLSDIFPFQFTQSSHFAQLHFLSACFCNQHPVNLFLHGFLCLFAKIITNNIYCLPDLLCKCVSFCFCIHHFLHNHLFPFFPVPDRERIVFVPAGSLSVR